MSAEKSKPAVPAPPKRGRGFLGTIAGDIPNVVQPKMNPRLQDLSFRVDPEFHREFKLIATARGISMKELLEEAFSLWKAQNLKSGQLPDR